MIIHQIFLKVSNKTINDYPCYLEGSALWQEFCSKNGWEYRLHTEIDESIMTEEELDILKKGSKRYPFFAVDYYRLILLSKYGGMYVDLDVVATAKFELIKDKDIIIGRSIDKGDNNFYVNNNIMKLTPELIELLKQYSIQQTHEKLNMKVYETRKIRFFLHTVGAMMLARFCKKHKLSFCDDYDDYFIDYNTQTWDKI